MMKKPWKKEKNTFIPESVILAGSVARQKMGIKYGIAHRA